MKRIKISKRCGVSEQSGGSDLKGHTTEIEAGGSELGGKALWEEIFRRSRGCSSLDDQRETTLPPKCCSLCAGFGRLNVGICLMLIAPRDVGRICATSLVSLTACALAGCTGRQGLGLWELPHDWECEVRSARMGTTGHVHGGGDVCGCFRLPGSAWNPDSRPG
jgi:hypothetical protein